MVSVNKENGRRICTIQPLVLQALNLLTYKLLSANINTIWQFWLDLTHTWNPKWFRRYVQYWPMFQSMLYNTGGC